MEKKIQVASTVVRILEALLDIPVRIGGSAASYHHGATTREPKDVDVVICGALSEEERRRVHELCINIRRPYIQEIGAQIPKPEDYPKDGKFINNFIVDGVKIDILVNEEISEIDIEADDLFLSIDIVADEKWKLLKALMNKMASTIDLLSVINIPEDLEDIIAIASALQKHATDILVIDGYIDAKLSAADYN